MTRKSIYEEEIFNLRVWPKDRVLIQRVEVIMPRPLGDDFDGLKLRNAGRDCRPDFILP